MKLSVLDAAGVLQSVVVNGQEAVVNASGILSSGAAQTIAAASTFRSGYFFQNLSTHSMWINDMGTATASFGSVLVPAGGSVSAPYNYPLTTNALSLIGTSGDAYTLRTW
jgi:hypothetical protein